MQLKTQNPELWEGGWTLCVLPPTILGFMGSHVSCTSCKGCNEMELGAIALIHIIRTSSSA